MKAPIMNSNLKRLPFCLYPKKPITTPIVSFYFKNKKLPFCLYPKMRSIHWWIWHETNSDSRACLLILTNSWGLEAQGGSSTLLTSDPSSIWPNLKPFMFTNISGRQKNSGISSWKCNVRVLIWGGSFSFIKTTY